MQSSHISILPFGTAKSGRGFEGGRYQLCASNLDFSNLWLIK